MKLISAALVAASVGTCSVGGQQKLPPSPAEQAATAPPTKVASDPWVGIADQCRQLASPCDECDEVERIRRKIEFKKCVPVCDAYLERTEVLAEIPQDAITLLQRADVCGKSETSCSPIEQSRCEYLIGYTTAGALFRARAVDGPGADGLALRFHEEFLTPYLDHHQRVASWAASNEVPAEPMTAVGGELLSITASALISEVTSTLATAQDASLPAISALVDLARYPGDAASFDERRGAAEAPLRR